MFENTFDQIVEITSKLTKTKILLISRFGSLDVLSSKESRKSNDSRKIVEIREEIIFIVDKDFLRKTRFTCVDNSRFKELIEATHQSIV